MIKTAYGEAQKFISKLRKHNKQNNFLFFLVAAGTETIEHQGISAAGASHNMLKYTAALDAEYLEYEATKTFENLPVSPENIMSPAILSKTCLNLTESQHFIINAGTFIKPQLPFIDTQTLPSKSVETGHAIELDEAIRLFQYGQKIVNQYRSFCDYFVLGECVVGGTTTALGLLKALGFDCPSMISSSFPNGNHDLKDKLVTEGYQNAISRYGSEAKLQEAVNKNPLEAISIMGDPMQAIVAGMCLEAIKINKPVLLAGGSQMIAIASLVEKIIFSILDKKEFGTDIFDRYQFNEYPHHMFTVGTTQWVANDASAQIEKLMQETCQHTPLIYYHFEDSIFSSNGDSPQSIKLLNAYNNGHVKEGVGAGALLVASKLSHDVFSKQIFNEMDRLINPSAN